MDADSFDRLTRLPRRDFIRLMSLGGAAATLRYPSDAAPITPPLPVARRSPWPIFRLARPEDHLCVEIELVNLQVVAETGERAQSRRIHVASHGDNGYIVLRFPGQHFAEQALWDRGPQIPSDQRKEDRTGDPSAPLTYPLWRQKARLETAPTTNGKRQDALADLDEKRNDNLAFLLLGPWRVPKPMPPNDPEARRLGLGQELDRQRRARRAFPQAWEVWADKDKPAPWDEGHIVGRGGWNHAGWTRGMAGLWVSGPSQLVFEVPQWRAPFPCDADAILRLCTQLDLVVTPQLDPTFDQPQDNRQPERREPPLPEALAGHHPGDLPPVTSIEFPTLLYLSPYANARWRLRPTVAGGAAELWALELERPRAGAPAPGTPRQRREAGHLFAFGRRAVEEARWPQDIDGAPPLDEGRAGKTKYTDFESPKTTLYDATRRLLVLQLREDNGDITAEHLSLTALGASADLRYRPLLDPQGDKPVAEVQPKPKEGDAKEPPLPPHRILRKDPKDEGFLTEWIQKTELGRDYYSKEAFAGWWMPWGFKAESVTITERLPCIDPWLEFRQGEAACGPVTFCARPA